MSKITLTANMIQLLAMHSATNGQISYTLSHSDIPAFDGFPGYSGLIAYSDSDGYSVLALEDGCRGKEISSRNGTDGTRLDGGIISRNQKQVVAAFCEHAHTGEKNKSGAVPYTEEMKLHLMRLIINDDIEGLNNALNSSANLIQG